jgi:hypothetical protein
MALSLFWSHATPHMCYGGYWLSGDSGVSVYNAWQVADGRALYADVFEFKFPLFFYLWGAVMWLTGPSASVAQWLTLLTMSLVAPVSAVVIHRLGGNRLFASAAGVVPVILFFAVWPFPFTPWLGWLMFAIAAYCLTRAFPQSAGPDLDPDTEWVNMKWLIRAGMFTGLFVLSIQSIAIPFAGGATLAMALVLPRRRWSLTGWFVAGGILVAMPFVLYLTILGALDDAIYQTLIWPVTHYYNGYIKGHYPGAGTVEWFERRGACKVPGASSTVNHLYTITVAGVPGLAVISFLSTVGVVGALIVNRIRRGAARVVTSPRMLILGVLAGGGFASFMPQVIVPSLSDPAHIAFAAVVICLPFAVLSSWGPRGWRWPTQAVTWFLFAVLVVVYVHRYNKYKPFRKKFRHHDQYVERYARAQWMKELTEPGDLVVHMPYGGWQYFTSRPSGTSHTWVFNDDKITSKYSWNWIIRDFKEREPELMVFVDKGLQRRFFKMDPTLRKRYFWNGKAWERRTPPLPHDTLAKVYDIFERGKPGGTLTITQNGQELKAVRKPLKGGPMHFTGSVRSHRVFLITRGAMYLIYRRPNGNLVGEWRYRGRHKVELRPKQGAAPSTP